MERKIYTFDEAYKASLEYFTGDELAASTNCLGDVFLPNYQESFKLSGKIEAMTANTKTRAYRYMEYNRAASGSSTLLPTGDTCK